MELVHHTQTLRRGKKICSGKTAHRHSRRGVQDTQTQASDPRNRGSISPPTAATEWLHDSSDALMLALSTQLLLVTVEMTEDLGV